MAPKLPIRQRLHRKVNAGINANQRKSRFGGVSHNFGSQGLCLVELVSGWQLAGQSAKGPKGQSLSPISKDL